MGDFRGLVGDIWADNMKASCAFLGIDGEEAARAVVQRCAEAAILAKNHTRGLHDTVIGKITKGFVDEAHTLCSYLHSTTGHQYAVLWSLAATEDEDKFEIAVNYMNSIGWRMLSEVPVDSAAPAELSRVERIMSPIVFETVSDRDLHRLVDDPSVWEGVSITNADLMAAGSFLRKAHRAIMTQGSA